mmetsp:Transcript_23352/g.46488  ORF Transcript_23352/g.46488 Transcript_23352/m.46488 type:complete len:229 (-) Transcript_23352:2279-2965(-)
MLEHLCLQHGPHAKGLVPHPEMKDPLSQYLHFVRARLVTLELLQANERFLEVGDGVCQVLHVLKEPRNLDVALDDVLVALAPQLDPRPQTPDRKLHRLLEVAALRLDLGEAEEHSRLVQGQVLVAHILFEQIDGSLEIHDGVLTVAPGREKDTLLAVEHSHHRVLGAQDLLGLGKGQLEVVRRVLKVLPLVEKVGQGGQKFQIEGVGGPCGPLAGTLRLVKGIPALIV